MQERQLTNEILFVEMFTFLHQPYLADTLRSKETLRKKYPSFEFFWTSFSRISTEYGDLLCRSPYSVRIRKNTDQKKSEYEHFSRRETFEFDPFLRKHSHALLLQLLMQGKLAKTDYKFMKLISCPAKTDETFYM